MSEYSKMYIAVIDEFPVYMTPTLVAHTVAWAYSKLKDEDSFKEWNENSFRKVVISVSRKEFDKIKNLQCRTVVEGHENSTLNGEVSCLICIVKPNEKIPRTLRNAKLWKGS